MIHRREGTVTLDGALDLGPPSLGAPLFDGNARFEYRLPWELQGGVALGAADNKVEVQFALGANYRLGAASEVLVRTLLNGGPLLTKIDVHSGGLIYSVAYQF